MNEDQQTNLKDSPLFGGGIYWDWQRILSVVVAGAYLLLVLLASPSGSFKVLVGTLLLTAGALTLPLACIWFSDEMGGYTGPLSSITKISPGSLIRIGGWILLFLPVIAATIFWWIG